MLISKNIKKKIIDVAYKANKGHIGSALSISDLLIAIFNEICEIDFFDEERYSLTLSKGHAALGLYCCLNELNLISDVDLFNYESDGTLLGTHPDPSLPLVNYIGGSLGQGLAFSAGSAFADKLQDKNRKHFVILSDSELNSGITWEIFTFAGTHKLNNLIVVLDSNKQQALDLTKNILNYEDIQTTIKTFGWEVSEVDGHDLLELKKSVSRENKKPHLVIANTKFGAGISFMDGNISWHYQPLSKDLYELALKEIEMM